MIRARDVPGELAAVLSGHIHRFQFLAQGPGGKELGSPVFYPGAIDRVSFAERDEAKGYLVFTPDPAAEDGLPRLAWKFRRLPPRPMVVVDIRPGPTGKDGFTAILKRTLEELPSDAIVNLKIHGRLADDRLEVLRAYSLRNLASPGMNIRAILVDYRRRYGTGDKNDS